MAATSKLHPRRPAKVGLSDPICLTCYATVSDCDPDGRPAEQTKHHICNSAFLAERGLLTRAERKHVATPLPGAA